MTRHGWIGVDLFFVLSGFLIGSQILREVSRTGGVGFARFYARRAFRILPAYLVVVAVYALLPAWRESPNLPPVWRFVSFTQNIGLRRGETGAFTHAWSLCIEEHFYLLLPLLVMLARKWRPERVALMIVSAMAAAVVVRAMLWVFVVPGFNESRGWYSENASWMYYPTFSHFDGLVFGVGLACVRIFRPHWWARLVAAPLMALVIAALCLAVVIIWGDLTAGFGAVSSFTFASAAGAAFIVVASSAEGERVAQILPYARLLASLAYPIYLTHKLVLHAFRVGAPALELDPFSAQVVTATLAACVLAGAALHVAVEQPMLRLRDRMLQAS